MPEQMSRAASGVEIEADLHDGVSVGRLALSEPTGARGQVSI